MGLVKALLAAALVSLAAPSRAETEFPPAFEALHQALHLRPEQEQAWIFFEHAMAPDAQDAEKHRAEFQRMEDLQAPQRMELSVQMMRADLENLERRANAMKAFYAVLSADQKDTFDRETLPSEK
jgi:hypothetical protein